MTHGSSAALLWVLFKNDGDAVSIASQSGAEVLIIGGVPIGEPIARYGPFVMNTREEIQQAIADYNKGRMGSIPAEVKRT